MRWTIRAKLSALVLAVLLPLVAGAVLKFSRDLGEERAGAQAQLLQTSQVVARNLDEVLSGQFENLQVLASVRSLERLQDDDLASLAARVRAGHPFVHRFLTATPDGFVTASSGPRVPESVGSFVEAATLEAAIQDGEPQVGRPQPSATDGRLVVPLIVPVRDRGGRMSGVAAAEIDLAALSSFLVDVSARPGASTTLVTADGTTLARAGSPPQPPGQKIPGGPEVERLLERRSGIGEWRWGDNVVYLAGAAPLRRAPWTVIATIPSDQAYAAAVARAHWNFLGLGLVTLVTVLGAWLLGRRTTRSVQALISGVRGLAAGQAAPVTVPSRDELAELAEQFNRAVAERRQAEAAVEARQRRLRALAEVNLSVSQQLDLERLLQQITGALAHLTGAHTVVLWGADRPAGLLVRRAWTMDASIASLDLPDVLWFEQGATGWIARHRQPLYVEDVAADARMMAVDWALRHELVAFAGVPVISGEELLGVLTLNLKRGRLPQGDDRALLSSFASQAAVAIRNARLFAEAEKRRRHAETLSDLGRVLAQALDPDLLAHRIADSVCRLLDARNSGLYRLEPRSGDLVCVAESGEVGPTDSPGLACPAGTGVMELALRERRPIATPNVLADPQVTLTPEARARTERMACRAVLGVPLVARGVAIGALAVGDVEGRVFGEDEIRLVQGFADQAAQALDNARLYAEATRRRREAEELARVARMLTESLDIADVGQRIVESVLSLFNVTSSRLCLTRADGSLEVIASHGRVRASCEPGSIIAPGIDAVGLAMTEGRPVWCSDVLGNPRYVLSEEARRYVEQVGDKAILTVPLTVAGRQIGAIILNDRAGREFSAIEVALLQTFADQAALALDNARLHEETRQRLRHLDSLREVVEQILVPFRLEERLTLIARKAGELFGADRATIALRDADRDELVVRAGYRLTEGEVGRVLQPGHGAAGVAASRREGVLVNDYASWPSRDAYIVETYQAQPAQAVIAYPLLVRDQVIGTISVGQHAPGKRFVQADLDRLASLAAPAALAIEHSRLYAELGARLRELQDTQTQLVQAGKLSAVGQLVSGVAHELNNPLSVVIGYGQLLLGKDLPPAVRRPLELIVAQGDRMAKIIHGLLLFSRQRKPERVAVRLRDVIEQTIALRVNQLTLSGIRLETDFSEDVPVVEGDAQQLQQVFLNLLLNAEQAILGSGAGGPRTGDRICVATGTRTESGACWVVAQVTDNGPGIPPEVMPRIFEPFFTTRRVGEGIGLGLSVSYGILQQHGGRLSAESRPGRTIFTIELPSATAAAADRSAEASNGRRALMVENDLRTVELVTTLLRQHGWKVDLTPGGRSALERLRAARYDLVVSDIRVAGGGEGEFYRAATAERGELAERFLFITDDIADPETRDFLQATGALVLQKPFTSQELLRAIRKLTS